MPLSEQSKLHFWMGFGGSLTKDMPDHRIYIEAVQLAKGHMGWDLPTGWSLPTSRHHVFFPLKNTMHGPRSKFFEWGGLFLAPLFLLNYFLFNLFFILAKKRGPCHRTKYQESVIGNVEEICETGYIFFTASINLFYTSSFPRSKLSFCNERSCQSVDISTQIL